jgi:hypothetical protein
MRRTIVRYGFRQARRHPRAVLRVTTAAALHPTSRRAIMQFARSSPSERRIVGDVLATLQASRAAQRASARKARRRARVRKVAIGASVVGAGVGIAAVAGRSLRSAA